MARLAPVLSTGFGLAAGYGTTALVNRAADGTIAGMPASVAWIAVTGTAIGVGSALMLRRPAAPEGIIAGMALGYILGGAVNAGMAVADGSPLFSSGGSGEALTRERQ